MKVPSHYDGKYITKTVRRLTSFPPSFSSLFLFSLSFFLSLSPQWRWFIGQPTK